MSAMGISELFVELATSGPSSPFPLPSPLLQLLPLPPPLPLFLVSASAHHVASCSKHPDGIGKGKCRWWTTWTATSLALVLLKIREVEAMMKWDLQQVDNLDFFTKILNKAGVAGGRLFSLLVLKGRLFSNNKSATNLSI